MYNQYFNLIHFLWFFMICFFTSGSGIVMGQNLNDSIQLQAEIKKAKQFLADFQQDSALKYLKNAQKIAQEYEMHLYNAKCLCNIGICYKNKEEYDSALFYYEQSFFLAKKMNSLRLLAAIDNNRGTVCLEIGAYKKAEEFFLSSLVVKRQLKDFKRIGSTLLNLGEVNLRLKDYVKAEEYYRQSLDIRTEIKDTFGIASCWINLAILHKRKDEFIQSEKLYLQILELCTSEWRNVKHVKLTALENLGSLYLSQKQYKKALKFIEKAETLAKTINRNTDISYCLNTKAQIYLGQGFAEKARKPAIEAFQLANQLGYTDALADYAQTISEIYISLDSTNQSVEWLQTYISFKDSLTSIENQKYIKGLEYEFESTMLKKENLLKDSELKIERSQKEIQAGQKRKAYWIVILLALLITIVIFFALQLLKKKKAIESQNQKLAESNQTITHKNKELSEAKQELQKSYEEIEQKNQLIQEYQDKYIKPLSRQLQVKNENGKLEYIDLRDIVYFQKGADVGKNSLKIYTSLGRIYHKKISVKALLEELSDTSFARIDTSTIVNLHFIEEIDIENNTITLEAKVENTELERVESVKKALTIPETGKIGTEFFKKYDHFLLSQA